MKMLKKDNGHTLVELVIVMAMVGIVSVLIWSIYLSIHRNNIRADKKAQNLEDARVIINNITDNFQTYGGCSVENSDGNKLEVITQTNSDDPVEIEKAEEAASTFYTISNIIFNEDESDEDKKVFVEYDNESKIISWKKNGVSNELDNTKVSDFQARLDGDLLDIKIKIINEGHGVVSDQIIDVGTTLNLKYMDKLPEPEEEGEESN